MAWICWAGRLARRSSICMPIVPRQRSTGAATAVAGSSRATEATATAAPIAILTFMSLASVDSPTNRVKSIPKLQ